MDQQKQKFFSAFLLINDSHGLAPTVGVHTRNMAFRRASESRIAYAIFNVLIVPVEKAQSQIIAFFRNVNKY